MGGVSTWAKLCLSFLCLCICLLQSILYKGISGGWARKTITSQRTAWEEEEDGQRCK